jgi:acetyltransferase (GNAT) family protein
MTAGSMKRTLAIGSRGRLSRPGVGLIRSASQADADLIRDFVCGLSPRSQYFRFFATVSPPSSGLLRALTGATGSADVLLVTDAAGAMIGHGMAADTRAADGHLETNIGLVIDDQWQLCGLGTTLLTTLVSRAAGRGVHNLVMDVLPENDRMRGIINRRWPDAPLERTRDALIIRPAIRAATARHAIELPIVIDLHPRGAGPSRTPQTTPPAATDRYATSHAGGGRAPGQSAA